jgi:hypothetical protein
MLEYIQKGREGKGRERITIQKSSVMKNGIAHSTLPLSDVIIRFRIQL